MSYADTGSKIDLLCHQNAETVIIQDMSIDRIVVVYVLCKIALDLYRRAEIPLKLLGITFSYYHYRNVTFF